MKIASNRLLFGSVLCLAVYWTFASIVPWMSFSPFISLLLVVTSGLTFLRFVPDTFGVLFQGNRNESAPDGDGSHLSIYGTCLIAAGGILSSLAAFAVLSETLRPFVEHRPFELIGRFIAACGLALVFISPSVNRQGIKFEGGLWFYVAATVMMVVVYLLGFNAGAVEHRSPIDLAEEHIPADRPRCPEDRPIWGSKSGVYHSPGSKYRALTFPARCFAAEDEAREAGFRPAQ